MLARGGEEALPAAGVGALREAIDRESERGCGLERSKGGRGRDGSGASASW